MSEYKKEETIKLNFWAMVRDLGIKAISTGTFFPFSLFIIALLLILKMPGKDLSSLVSEVLTSSMFFCVFGYIISIITVIAWKYHVKMLTNYKDQEIERLVSERNSLQKQLLPPGEVQSSMEVKK